MKKLSKKALITGATALAMATTLVAGGSLAYFSSSVQARNTITFGNVAISISEDDFKPEQNIAVVPGKEIDKNPTIKNTGKNPCFLRVKLAVDERYASGTGTPGVTITAEELTKIEENTSWLLSGGYYYYQQVLTPGAAVEMFDKLVIPSEWGNSYAGVTFDMDVQAEAVQSENFTPQRDKSGKIIGWNNFQMPN